MYNNIKAANHIVTKNKVERRLNPFYYMKQTLYIIGAIVSFIWLVVCMRYGWYYTNYNTWIMIPSITVSIIALASCIYNIGSENGKYRRHSRRARNSGRV